MKSYEFLIENDIKAIKNEFNMIDEQIVFAKAVRDNCGYYLEQVNYQPLSKYALYRGLKNVKTNMFANKIRLNDRKPLNSSNILHTALNNFYMENYGAPFRNAMFCTGEYQLAQEFGDAYTVFPVGNFKFLWDMDSKDIYVDYLNFNRQEHLIKHLAKKEFRDKEKVVDAFIKHRISKHKFDNTDLMTAINRGHEIMLRGSSYLACRLPKNIELGIEAIIKL